MKRLPPVLSLLLVIACAHSLAKLTWMLMPQPEQNNNIVTINKNRTNTSQHSNQQIDQLTSAHLFGEANLQAATNTKKAPDTKLNLVLRGVLASGSPKLASAIIARGKAGKEEIYGTGDKLPGGVTVKEIHAEYVLLMRQGKIEKLRLTKDKGIVLRTSTNKTSARAGTPGAALKTIRSNIMKNPTSFGDYALPVAINEKGKLIGYKLRPQKKGAELMKQLGLQPQDIITTINGIQLNKPENGIGALRKLTSAQQVNLLVRRNGVEIPLNISLQ